MGNGGAASGLTASRTSTSGLSSPVAAVQRQRIAPGAAVDEDPLAVAADADGDRLHARAAVGRPIAGVVGVEVAAPQAVRAVVPMGRAGRGERHVQAAVAASERRDAMARTTLALIAGHGDLRGVGATTTSRPRRLPDVRRCRYESIRDATRRPPSGPSSSHLPTASGHVDRGAGRKVTPTPTEHNECPRQERSLAHPRGLGAEGEVVSRRSARPK